MQDTHDDDPLQIALEVADVATGLDPPIAGARLVYRAAIDGFSAAIASAEWTALT
ncbi:hypothetical protein ACEWB4_05615 [Sphingobium sp. sgz301303]|uniref:hypothetical protein n=1 Tax=Sphingobium sp. sgz301304 TaxID=3341828 RepID=UPI0035A61544